VVQKVLFPGYIENRQSRASQGILGFECNPDLNHALSPSLGSASTPLIGLRKRAVYLPDPLPFLPQIDLEATRALSDDNLLELLLA
jgi:hypothetical protein